MFHNGEKLNLNCMRIIREQNKEVIRNITKIETFSHLLT